MQGNVVSFQIDHTKLKPGVYLHEHKYIHYHYVTTYDLRFKKPNGGSYLTPIQAHTIEHVLATFFTRNHKDKLYFGPMGCLTGFYLVLDGFHELSELLPLLDEADSYWETLMKENFVPAKTPVRCGNYRLLSIEEGYKAWKEFYALKDQWGTEYPVLPDDFTEDLSKYKEDF